MQNETPEAPKKNSRDLSAYFWVRIGVMVLSFFAVVGLIYKLNQFSPSDLTLILCPTRVSAINTADGKGIVQDGMRWYRRNNGNLEELDPVAVEKWFGKNCKVAIEPVSKAESTGVLFVVNFISGPPETLYVAGDGLFRWQNRTFKSQQLEEAMNSLKDLPLFLRPTSR